MTASVLGFLLMTACASGSTAGGDGAGVPSTTPTTTLPSGTPDGSATPVPPSDDPTAVPPADAAPCPTAYDTTGNDSAAAAPPATDPAGAQPWVPAPPGTQTDGRLAPDADPVEVVLCRYAAITTGPAALDGPPVRISSDLLRVRTDLQVPPRAPEDRACAPDGPRVPYLARLAYADGDLWIASTDTANGCALTGNGVFVSGSSRGGQLAASYDAGAWVPAVGS